MLYAFPLDVSGGDLIRRNYFLARDADISVLINEALSDLLRDFYSSVDFTDWGLCDDPCF